MRDHDDLTARQRRLWERAAPHYDRSMALAERLWFGGGREWLGARAHGRVLEVAIGTGADLPHYRADAVVTGVDLSPGMLAVARARAAEIGREVELVEGDAERLPFPGASFDTVVCALALCSIPDPARAIGEMHRVLVPGGRLLLLDHVGSTWLPLRWTQRLVEQVTVRTAGEHFTRRSRPLVECSGFAVEEAERLQAGTVERLRARKPG
ncbi:phosphatidylethanolamine N-methyltransferase /phosphatidyl-N-methylethanolamine N-methyltransferase [Agrococcus baldri]|uniref:Phosphatidylethanolamine N-methyltransferase /phosphatidyl-N-methylethanolamine N-methyltransferase n=1 Tax=Agrococcus baldri TaxID=153730 RepID=A0AA94L0H4_9MICO|nr:methyltransferase domain-containing protein [Agrococcus baldri]SFS17992.1 phosphatidylethanolamine N-methyltransferase /phosphatidyl-N-methylethanolamine N-methyltransferase [Agrococcus baldri]